MQPSYRTAGIFHLLSKLVALTTPRRPQSGCDGLSHLKRTQASPLYLSREFNLIACRNLTWHAGSSGSRTHAAELASQARCTAAQRISSLSHEGRSAVTVLTKTFHDDGQIIVCMVSDLDGILPSDRQFVIVSRLQASTREDRATVHSVHVRTLSTITYTATEMSDNKWSK